MIAAARRSSASPRLDRAAALDDDFDLQDTAYQFSADAPKDTVIAATGRDAGGNAVDLTTVRASTARRGPSR